MPVPESGESLVRILMAAVCNTDKEILKGYRPDFQGIMGHEFVGVVESSPDPKLAGKRVVGELNASCGHCIYCRTGRPTHCSSRRVLGMHQKDGCFGEYMTIDTKLLHVVPDGLATKAAIYTEPLAAAFEIMTQVTLTPEKNVAILGDGRLSYCVAQAMSAVGKAAQSIVVEVRRQFQTMPGLLEGKAKPDYASCVDMCTRSAQKLMLAPALIAVITPIVTGLILGVDGVAGLLAGNTITGFVLAVMMANSGGAWDNAKKYIESGKLGGKGSDAHKAAVIGDTVGDPFKDTSGPSINILIKLTSMISIVFAGLVMAVHLL